MNSRPHVLLLEDDPFMQQFVELALQDLPVQLHHCNSLAQARQLLQTQSVQLLLADMHLPDGSASSLCTELCAAPLAVAGPAARVVIFSGGIDAAQEQALRRSGVWLVLHKPVAMEQLLACVKQALHEQPPQPAADSAAALPQPPTFFGDRQALFVAYQRTCLEQFAYDVIEGNRAAHSGDWAALQRLAHNLKSVLVLLGHPTEAKLARTLETQAHVGAHTAAQATWHLLQAQLQQLQLLNTAPP